VDSTGLHLGKQATPLQPGALDKGFGVQAGREPWKALTFYRHPCEQSPGAQGTLAWGTEHSS
jgi:hypothetical protein